MARSVHHGFSNEQESDGAAPVREENSLVLQSSSPNASTASSSSASAIAQARMGMLEGRLLSPSELRLLDLAGPRSAESSLDIEFRNEDESLLRPDLYFASPLANLSAQTSRQLADLTAQAERLQSIQRELQATSYAPFQSNVESISSNITAAYERVRVVRARLAEVSRMASETSERTAARAATSPYADPDRAQQIIRDFASRVRFPPGWREDLAAREEEARLNYEMTVSHILERNILERAVVGGGIRAAQTADAEETRRRVSELRRLRESFNDRANHRGAGGAESAETSLGRRVNRRIERNQQGQGQEETESLEDHQRSFLATLSATTPRPRPRALSMNLQTFREASPNGSVPRIAETPYSYTNVMEHMRLSVGEPTRSDERSVVPRSRTTTTDGDAGPSWEFFTSSSADDPPSELPRDASNQNLYDTLFGNDSGNEEQGPSRLTAELRRIQMRRPSMFQRANPVSTSQETDIHRTPTATHQPLRPISPLLVPSQPPSPSASPPLDYDSPDEGIFARWLSRARSEQEELDRRRDRERDRLQDRRYTIRRRLNADGEEAIANIQLRTEVVNPVVHTPPPPPPPARRVAGREERGNGTTDSRDRSPAPPTAAAIRASVLRHGRTLLQSGAANGRFEYAQVPTAQNFSRVRRLQREIRTDANGDPIPASDVSRTQPGQARLMSSLSSLDANGDRRASGEDDKLPVGSFAPGPVHADRSAPRGRSGGLPRPTRPLPVDRPFFINPLPMPIEEMVPAGSQSRASSSEGTLKRCRAHSTVIIADFVGR